MPGLLTYSIKSNTLRTARKKKVAENMSTVMSSYNFKKTHHHHSTNSSIPLTPIERFLGGKREAWWTKSRVKQHWNTVSSSKVASASESGLPQTTCIRIPYGALVKNRFVGLSKPLAKFLEERPRNLHFKKYSSWLLHIVKSENSQCCKRSSQEITVREVTSLECQAKE